MMDESSGSTKNTRRPNRSQTDTSIRLFSVDPCMPLSQKDQEIPCDCRTNAQQTVQRNVLRKIYTSQQIPLMISE